MKNVKKEVPNTYKQYVKSHRSGLRKSMGGMPLVENSCVPGACRVAGDEAGREVQSVNGLRS